MNQIVESGNNQIRDLSQQVYDLKQKMLNRNESIIHRSRKQGCGRDHNRSKISQQSGQSFPEGDSILLTADSVNVLDPKDQLALNELKSRSDDIHFLKSQLSESILRNARLVKEAELMRKKLNQYRKIIADSRTSQGYGSMITNSKIDDYLEDDYLSPVRSQQFSVPAESAVNSEVVSNHSIGEEKFEPLKSATILDHCYSMFKKAATIPQLFERMEKLIRKVMGADVKNVYFMVCEKQTVAQIKSKAEDLLRIKEFEVGQQKLCLVVNKKKRLPKSNKKQFDKFGKEIKDKAEENFDIFIPQFNDVSKISSRTTILPKSIIRPLYRPREEPKVSTTKVSFEMPLMII